MYSTRIDVISCQYLYWRLAEPHTNMTSPRWTLPCTLSLISTWVVRHSILMQSHSNADDQAAGVAVHDRLILSSTTIQGIEAPDTILTERHESKSKWGGHRHSAYVTPLQCRTRRVRLRNAWIPTIHLKNQRKWKHETHCYPTHPWQDTYDKLYV